MVDPTSAVGCQIPADMRVIELLSSQLRVDQAILTGLRTWKSSGNIVVVLSLWLNRCLSWVWVFALCPSCQAVIKIANWKKFP